MYNDIGKSIEGNALITKAHRIAIEAIPEDFNIEIDQLHWNNLENRPFLRVIHCYGLELMKEQNFEKAIKEFEFILKINPNDNQGVRYLIIDCLFHLNKPDKILALCKLYHNDNSVEFLYGKVLASYLLGKKSTAKRQLIKAKEAFPFVADELVKTSHVFPFDEFEHQYGMDGYGYPIGSRQQAFDYWNTTQKFWDKAIDVKKFIKNSFR